LKQKSDAHEEEIEKNHDLSSHSSANSSGHASPKGNGDNQTPVPHLVSKKSTIRREDTFFQGKSKNHPDRLALELERKETMLRSLSKSKL